MDQLVMAIALWCSNYSLVHSDKNACQVEILNCIFDDIRGDYLIKDEGARYSAIHNCMKKRLNWGKSK